MRKRTMIRTTVVLAAFCLFVWRAPALIERLEQLRLWHGMTPEEAGAMMSPHVIDLQWLNEAGGTERGAKQQREAVVITPRGELTPQERVRMLEEARRMAPGGGRDPLWHSAQPASSAPPRVEADDEDEDVDVDTPDESPRRR